MTPKTSTMMGIASPKRKCESSTGRVFRLLDAIGLQYAWTNFEAAGIITSEALSEIPTAVFPALGVTDPDDKRKLFYLVQSLQLAKQNSSSSPSAEDRETPVRKTPSRSRSSENFVSQIPSPQRAAGGQRTGPTANDSKPVERGVSRNSSYASAQELLASEAIIPSQGEAENENDCEPEADDEFEGKDNYDDDNVDETDDDLDEFKDAVQDHITELAAPRRSQRLQGKLETVYDVKSKRSTKSTTAPLHATTATNRRMSRLSTPKKHSSVPTRNIKNHPLEPRMLPPTEQSRRAESPEKVLQSAPSLESTGSSVSAQRNDSFQSQIETLREAHVEEHDLFAPKDPDEDHAATGDMRIRVVIRKRPMSNAEVAMAGNVDILQPLDYQSFGKVLVYQPRTRVDLTKEIETVPFCFDNVFDEEANNAHIYERAVRPLIPGLFDGQWATLFAYGQTGSGKTYTMLGSVHTTGASACNYGLYFMAAMDIFQTLRKYPDLRVGVSLFEIYSGKLFDLFNERKAVKCLEDAQGQIHFPGLSERVLESPHHLMEWIHEGSSLRSTGTTSRNADSSRSHAVMQLHLRKKSDGSEHSRLTLIDLAGSERGADTSTACRTTRMEGAEINTSLLALKEVIRALANGDSVSHVPFRGSKLTQVLKESFVGSKCRSVMIACVSPNIGNCEQTLNTLRYANRVKERNPDTGETDRHAVVASRNASTTSLPQIEIEQSEGALLDELLSENRVNKPSEPRGPKKQLLVGNPLKLAQETVALHKEIIPTLLEMIKDEMDLAKNEELSMEDHVRQISVYHQQQFEIFEALRDSIRAYREARSTVGQVIAEHKKSRDSDDDSVEDLRD